MEKCKKCGGGLNFSPQKQALVCQKCLKEYKITKDYDYGKQRFEMQELTIEKTMPQKFKSHCPNCGAIFNNEKYTMSDVCKYCGSSLVISFAEGVAPDGCVLFAFDKDTAREKFKEKLKKKWFIPRAVKKGIADNKIESVYIPAYLCDISTTNFYQGEIYTTSTDSHGDTVKHYESISGQKDVTEKNILLECSAEISQSLLEEIKPFDCKQVIKFAPEFLLGYSVEFFDKCLQDCKNQIKSIVRNRVKKVILKDYRYDGVNYLDINTCYNECKYSKILLPTYKFNYTYSGREYTTFMNGQNGKLSAGVPRSIFKIISFILGITFGIGVLMCLLRLIF